MSSIIKHSKNICFYLINNIFFLIIFWGILFLLLFVAIEIKYSYGTEFVDRCKRPSWKNIYVKEINCKMDYRRYFLFQNSKVPCVIERRKNKVCKVIEGLWEVRSFDGTIYISDPTQIDIDHILPIAYIANRVDCSQMNDYYHYNNNLMLTTKDYNKNKKDKICRSKDECTEQIDKCIDMAIKFDNAPLCTDLIIGKKSYEETQN